MHKRASQNVEMCSGPILKSLIIYTIPVVLTGVLQLLFNAADIIVVGRFCGSNAIAAVGATGSLTNLLVNLLLGLSVGVSVCTATALGAKNKRVVYRTVHTAIPISIIVGAVLTVSGLLFSGAMLKMMDTPKEIIALSSVYMKIFFCGAIPNMIYNFGAAVLRAVGDTKSPLKYLSFSGVLNVVLNIIFVTVFKLNVAGVALATIISQAVSAALVLKNLMRRQDECRLFISHMRIYWPQLKRILATGLPSGLNSSIFSISNVLIQSSINSFGAAVVAGNAAASNIEGFTYTAMNAFSVASVNFVGQNRGAKKYERIKKIILTVVASVFVVGLVLAIGEWLLAKPLLSIYITDNPDAIAIGVLRITCFLVYPLCGIMDSLTGAIRGLGGTITPMLISVICVCGIRIGWILTVFQLPDFHNLVSLYFSYPASWLTCIICQIIAISIIYKREKKKDG